MSQCLFVLSTLVAVGIPTGYAYVQTNSVVTCTACTGALVVGCTTYYNSTTSTRALPARISVTPVPGPAGALEALAVPES
eukprot:3402446-Rhodomonas_salina.1